MADVYCSGCGEPYDTYYLRHELPREYLPEQKVFVNAVQDYVDQSDLARADCRDDKVLTHTSFEVMAKRDGWEFAGSLLAVRQCPSCKHHQTPLPTAGRGAEVETAAQLLGDDTDGLETILEDLG